jgi:hypothetical protein
MIVIDRVPPAPVLASLGLDITEGLDGTETASLVDWPPGTAATTSGVGVGACLSEFVASLNSVC